MLASRCMRLIRSSPWGGWLPACLCLRHCFCLQVSLESKLAQRVKERSEKAMTQFCREVWKLREDSELERAKLAALERIFAHWNLPLAEHDKKVLLHRYGARGGARWPGHRCGCGTSLSLSERCQSCLPARQGPTHSGRCSAGQRYSPRRCAGGAAIDMARFMAAAFPRDCAHWAPLEVPGREARKVDARKH
jgi:hypothetical protein